MKVGDLVLKTLQDSDGPLNVSLWRVEGIFLGCTGQENLVELRSLTEKPGVPGRRGGAETTFVPLQLLEGLVYTKVDDV